MPLQFSITDVRFQEQLDTATYACIVPGNIEGFDHSAEMYPGSHQHSHMKYLMAGTTYTEAVGHPLFGELMRLVLAEPSQIGDFLP